MKDKELSDSLEWIVSNVDTAVIALANSESAISRLGGTPGVCKTVDAKIALYDAGIRLEQALATARQLKNSLESLKSAITKVPSEIPLNQSNKSP